MEEPPLIGYVGLGSNVGDRMAALGASIERLDAQPGVAVIAASSAWETAPQGEVLDQPDFLNAVVAVETALEPEELLERCKAVERAMGRERGGRRHGPRAIDLDVLLLGHVEFTSERLSVPHPELLTRRFVIEPLLEIDPEALLPDGTRVAAALPRVADQRVARAGAAAPGLPGRST